MSKSKSMCIELEDELYDKLLKISTEEDRSISYIIRRILREYFKKVTKDP